MPASRCNHLHVFVWEEEEEECAEGSPYSPEPTKLRKLRVGRGGLQALQIKGALHIGLRGGPRRAKRQVRRRNQGSPSKKRKTKRK